MKHGGGNMLQQYIYCTDILAALAAFYSFILKLKFVHDSHGIKFHTTTRSKG
jgi:hypothetical protein